MLFRLLHTRLQKRVVKAHPAPKNYISNHKYNVLKTSPTQQDGGGHTTTVNDSSTGKQHCWLEFQSNLMDGGNTDSQPKSM